MDTEPIDEVNKLSDEEKKLRTLFLLSFNYSQGDWGAQKKIMNWLVVNNHISIDELKNASPAFLTTLKVPKSHLDVEGGELGSFKLFWGGLAGEIEQSIDLSSSNIELSMFKDLIRVEEKYQKKGREGKPDQTNETKPDSMEDKYGSQIRKYILFQHPTGSGEYDVLFGKLRNLTYTHLHSIDTIGAAWETHHSGLKFYPEGFKDANPRNI